MNGTSAGMFSGSFLRNAAAGIAMGVGCILPGVSGGVMAVSFGLYRPMLDAVLGFFKDIKRNAAFLLPLAVGGVIGLLLGAVGLKMLMVRFEPELLFLFMGVILGGVPGIVREANEGGFNKKWLWALAAGASAALMLLYWEYRIGVPDMAMGELSPMQAALSGAIIAFGTIVPGISTSFVLIFLGWYEPVLGAISGMHIGTLMYLAAGCVICALAIMKLAKWLFDRFHGPAYYAVLGFLMVSIAMVFPGFGRGWDIAIRLLIFVIGGAAGLWFGRSATTPRDM